MARALLPVEESLVLLAETPALLTECARGLTPAQLRSTPRFGGWSELEVLGHLRACADMWGGSALEILRDNARPIRAVNPRTWIEQTEYLDQELARSLRAYKSQRTRLLWVIGRLAPAEWARSATVTSAGRPLERSVHFYAQWMARHDRSHHSQIRAIAASFA